MKNLFYDLLNGFTVHDLVLLFLQLFAALFIGQWLRILLKISGKSFSLGGATYAFVPLMVALVVVLSKNSAPLSIAALGIFILAGPLLKDSGHLEKSMVLLLGAAGFGCGSGYVLVTLLVFLLIVSPVLYWTAKKS